MNLDLCDDAAGARWLAALNGGQPWRDALEAHLCAIDLVEAERTMQVLKEGRGAWLALALDSDDGGPREQPAVAWFLGNALSGTTLVLERLGFRVVALDPSPTRCALAEQRARHLGRGALRGLSRDLDSESTLAQARAEAAGAPAVAIVEGPAQGVFGPDRTLTARLRALGVGRIWHVGDNRLGYKRSSGVRADLRVQSPWRWARNAISGRGRSLLGYRREAGSVGRSRALALYPPPLGLLSGRRPRWPRRRRRGPFPRTRRAAQSRQDARPTTGPVSLVHSVVRRRRARASAFVDPPLAGAHRSAHGRGTGCPRAHDRLARQQRHSADRWRVWSTRLGRAHPAGPRPGTSNAPTRGLRTAAVVACCARGLTGANPAVVGLDRRHVRTRGAASGRHQRAQLVEERDRERTLLPACAALLAAARLDGAARPLDAGERDQLIHARARAIAQRAEPQETARAVERLGSELDAALRGLNFCRVFGHGDLRAKHVAATPDGTPLAFLDLGCARASDLPLVDLLNLVLHARKDAAGTSLGAAWREARKRRLPAPLEAVLEDYAARLELPRAYDDAIRAAYPLFVASSAEQFWDFSRPRWVRRQLDL